MQRFSEIFDKRLDDGVDALLGVPHLIGRKQKKEGRECERMRERATGL